MMVAGVRQTFLKWFASRLWKHDSATEALQDFAAMSGSIVYIMVQYRSPELTVGAWGHYHHGKMTAPLSTNCFRFLLPQCSSTPPHRSSSRCYWPSCPCSPLPPQYRTGGPVTWTDCPIRPSTWWNSPRSCWWVPAYWFLEAKSVGSTAGWQLLGKVYSLLLGFLRI